MSCMILIRQCDTAVADAPLVDPFSADTHSSGFVWPTYIIFRLHLDARVSASTIRSLALTGLVFFVLTLMNAS
jgi:hypothetical protein